MSIMDYKDLVIPTLDVNDNKVTIENLRFRNLDRVNEGDVIYTVSTAKSVEDYMVDFSGYIVYFVGDGGDVKIGESAGMIFTNLKDAQEKLLEVERKTKSPAPSASKKALDYATELGFDISLIKKDGIIKVQDIVDYLKNNQL